MLLADTSVWVDHFRAKGTGLTQLLLRGELITHPHVIAELALGGLSEEALESLQALPSTRVATDEEVLWLIRARDLAGTGVGLVDAGLLAAALLSPGVLIWTRDRRLRAVAQEWGIAA